jgi:hypothetical protein
MINLERSVSGFHSLAQLRRQLHYPPLQFSALLHLISLKLGKYFF